jgi:tetratricopeptide (TPR) repeat protein
VLVGCTAFLGAACKTDPQDHAKRGIALVDQKNYGEGIVELRTALQGNARLGEARLKLADAYLATGKPAQALQELIRAADLLPNDAKVQLRAAKVLLLAQSYNDAKTRAERVLKLDPRNAEAYVVMGNALANLSELESALVQFDKALDVDAASAESYIGIGAIQATKKQTPDAEASFLKAVSVAPKSVRAQLALANFYWATRQFDKAEAAFRATLGIEPNNLFANRAMSVFLLATGRVADAEPYFVTMAKVSNVEGASALAQYYLLTARRADARRVLTEMTQRPETYADATVRLAYLDLAEGDRAAAWSRAKELLAKEPKNPRGLVLSATLLTRDRKYDEAITAVNKALTIDPSSARAHEAAGVVYAATDRRSDAQRSFENALKADQGSFVSAVSLAQLHLEARALDKSMTYAQQALALRPGNAEAQALVARNYMARGDVAQAKPIVEQLLKRTPNLAAAHDLNAALQLTSKQPDAARASYEHALALDANDIDAVTGLVLLDLSRGKKAEAGARIETTLARRNRDEASLLLAARSYAATGDLNKSETAFREALERNPNRLSTYAQLGELYRRENRLDDAVKQFERLLERDGRSVAASTMLGMIHEQRGDKPAAEREYRRALSINARAPIAANNLAWLYVSSNRQLEEALQLAQAAHQELPDEPNIADTLGWIYVQKRMETMAIPALESSVKQMPQNGMAQYHLGVAYLQSGDVVKARQALARSLTLGDFEGSADARKALQSLAN